VTCRRLPRRRGSVFHRCTWDSARSGTDRVSPADEAERRVQECLCRRTRSRTRTTGRVPHRRAPASPRQPMSLGAKAERYPPGCLRRVLQEIDRWSLLPVVLSWRSSPATRRTPHSGSICRKPASDYVIACNMHQTASPSVRDKNAEQAMHETDRRSWHACTPRAHRTGYSGPRLDRILKAAHSLDRANRKVPHAEACAPIWDDALGIYPIGLIQTLAFRSGTEGVVSNPGFPTFLNVRRA